MRDKKQGRVGIEPTTCRSAVDRSTTELTALTDDLSAFHKYQRDKKLETAEVRMGKEWIRNLSKYITNHYKRLWILVA